MRQLGVPDGALVRGAGLQARGRWSHFMVIAVAVSVWGHPEASLWKS